MEESPGTAEAPEDGEVLPAPPADEAQEEADGVGEAVEKMDYVDGMESQPVPPADGYDVVPPSQPDPVYENDISRDSLDVFGTGCPDELPFEYSLSQLSDGHGQVDTADGCLDKAEIADTDMIEITDSPCLERKASSANLGDESRSLRHGLPSTFSDTLSAPNFESYKQWLGVAKQKLDEITKDRFSKQLDSKLFKLS